MNLKKGDRALWYNGRQYRQGAMYMCGRYRLLTQDIRPGDEPEVFVLADGELTAKPMRWGMTLPEENRLVINARAETVEQKGMFAGLVRQNRCLVRASLYYEWMRTAAHTRMKIETGKNLYMAGLFRRSMEVASGWEFVVLTKPAVGEVAKVHDRMPMILPNRESRRAWMTDEPAARGLLQSPPEVLCRVQADEPEQLDWFSMMNLVEI